MYTGWRRNLRYSINRKLRPEEKREKLSRKAADSPYFADRGGLLKLNSTYIEWVDRGFRARGGGSTFGALITSALALSYSVVAVNLHPEYAAKEFFLLAYSTALFMIVVAYVFYYLQWGLDFFQKTCYPIRFNRKNRMIYVYRDKRDGGILQVPWEGVYFHVGRGMMNNALVDIRGEVMDGDIVKDAFAVGPYYPDNRVDAVQEAWAFICRYMEKGPEAVGPDPRDRYIENSLKGTWKDCMSVMYTNYTPIGNPAQIILGWPMIAITTITRWLVFKTCRTPKWTSEIEEACKIELDDPNIWPEPKYMDQFFLEMPDVRKREIERHSANVRHTLGKQAGPDLVIAMQQWENAMRREKMEVRRKVNEGGS